MICPIRSIICLIGRKNCKTKTEVCEHLTRDHMENINDDEVQPLSIILTPTEKKGQTTL